MFHREPFYSPPVSFKYSQYSRSRCHLLITPSKISINLPWSKCIVMIISFFVPIPRSFHPLCGEAKAYSFLHSMELTCNKLEQLAFFKKSLQWLDMNPWSLSKEASAIATQVTEADILNLYQLAQVIQSRLLCNRRRTRRAETPTEKRTPRPWSCSTRWGPSRRWWAGTIRWGLGLWSGSPN